MADRPSSTLLGLTSWVPWLVTTVLGGALVASRFNSAADPASVPIVLGSQEVPVEGISSPERIRRIEEPLFEYFGISPDQEVPAVNLDKAESRHSTHELLRSHLAGKDLQFLIVTVADPVDSGDNYRFDLQVDAIHKALQANSGDQWIFNGSYLPWQAFRDRTGLKRELSLVRKEHWYQDEPGLMLYRQSPPKRPSSKSERNVARIKPQGSEKLLFVFLVGELATTGVQRDAFRLAIDEIHRLRRIAQSGGRESDDTSPLTIPVIGPTFTGAATSLVNAIVECRDRFHNPRPAEDQQKPDSRLYSFRVLTGSAVGIDPAMFRTEGIAFDATLQHNDQTTAAIRSFLKEQDKNFLSRKTAWLVEASTGFGTSFSSGKPESDGKPKENQDYIFPYPLQISRVRARFEQTAADSSDRVVNPLRMTVPLAFDSLESRRDIPPQQTPQMTAPAVELLLCQIADVFRREEFDYVGIVATDVRDSIFLADLVKRHCPNAQLIIPVADLLHSHPQYARALRGALVASSYPLFPDGLPWMATTEEASQTRVLFSNQAYYGMYNAVLAHREIHADKGNYLTLPDYPTPKQLVGFGEPFSQTPPADATMPTGIWLQRIGNDGFYPVAWQPTNSSETESANRDQHYLIQLKALSDDTKRKDPSLPRFSESIAIWAISLSLIWVTWLAVIVRRFFPRVVLRFFPRWTVRSLEFVRPWKRRQARTGLHKAQVWSLMALANIYVTGIALIATPGWKDNSVNRLLVSFTHLNLFSGVSLVLPAILIYAAMFALIFGPWLRLNLIDSFRRPWFAPSLQSPPDPVEGIRHSLYSLRGNKSFAVLVVLSLTATYALVVHAWPRSVNVSGTRLLDSWVWMGLNITVLGWWYSMFQATGLFERFRQELHWVRHRNLKFDDPGVIQARDELQQDAFAPGVSGLLFVPRPINRKFISRCQESKSDAERDFLLGFVCIHNYFRHLRNHIFTLAASALLLVLAVNSYPFTATLWLRVVTTGGLVFVVMQVCWFYIKLEHDEQLSRMLGTSPNVVNWDWAAVLRLGTMVATATAILIVQVVPESGGWLGMIIEPIVRLNK